MTPVVLTETEIDGDTLMNLTKTTKLKYSQKLRIKLNL